MMKTTDKGVLKKILWAMMRSRMFEEKTIQLYQKGIVQGSLHPGIGHEAVGAGIAAGLNEDDYIFPHHRGLGSIMYRGIEAKYILAEWFGKSVGIGGGKGGVTHFADAKRNILGVNGIVGGNLPIAMGAALAQKMKSSGRVVVCCIGDGAINQGSFHESANMAGLWKLPVIYVIENNFYAFSVSLKNSSAVVELEKRASAYGIHGVVVDGMNPLNVKDAVEKAADDARRGKGPTLLNCLLYRYRGHSMSDTCKYRTRIEEAEWKSRDPIMTFSERLIGADFVDKRQIQEMEEEIAVEMNEAVKFSQESPSPNKEELYVNVFNEKHQVLGKE